jgi:hypothetical protein
MDFSGLARMDRAMSEQDALKKFDSRYDTFKEIKRFMLVDNRCPICGHKGPPEMFQFHHFADDKDFSIGGVNLNKHWDKVKSEIKKTILICRNCHAIVHARGHEASRDIMRIYKENYKHIVREQQAGFERFIEYMKDMAMTNGCGVFVSSEVVSK